ncbi:MAG: hypothetical protein NXI23_19370 [Bacteroidetes bacterium]|jgi:hypothetical protein|nr:hypothetical protein [Bacteroidota bacterium]
MIYGSGDKLLREFAEANDSNNLKGRFIKHWFLGSKNLDTLLIVELDQIPNALS